MEPKQEMSIGELLEQGLQTASTPLSSKGRGLEDRDSFDHILLTPDETATALRDARERKHYRLIDLEKEARAAEVRRQLTEKWDTNRTRDFMLWRAKRQNQGFELSDMADGSGNIICNIGTVFSLLCYYFSNDPRFVEEGMRQGLYRPDLRKGLLIAGGVGRGKTSLMNLFRVNQRQVFMLKTSAAISEGWATGGDEYLEGLVTPHMLPVNDSDNFYQRFAGLCIDDIGTEEIRNHFGNRKNVIGDLIEARYVTSSTGPLLHLTTNLSWEMLNGHYGQRVTSRLKETMNMIELKGEDRRK